MSDEDFRMQYELKPLGDRAKKFAKSYQQKAIEKADRVIAEAIEKEATYTGFRFTEVPLIYKAKQSYFVDWQWTTVPWYARLLGLLRLPYDLVKFVVTGRLILIPWPWRW